MKNMDVIVCFCCESTLKVLTDGVHEEKTETLYWTLFWHQLENPPVVGKVLQNLSLFLHILLNIPSGMFNKYSTESKTEK